MAKQGSDAAPVNGDQVWDTWFWQPPYGVTGYDPRQVDDLLRVIAAELDAERPAGPLVENATVQTRTRSKRYDIDGVDWFMGRFLVSLVPQGHVGLEEISDDPWHDVPVAQLVPGVEVRRALRSAGPGLVLSEATFSGQCEKAWRDFGQVPGTRLWWGSAGASRHELRTAEQQTLASYKSGMLKRPGRGNESFSAGGRSFRWKRTSAGGSSPPVVADLAARTARDHFGPFARNISNSGIWANLPRTDRIDWELVDEGRTPILYTGGRNYDFRARAWIMFPDQRWLRFLVRGTRRENAIMTAVDQAGNKVARYRIVCKAGRQRTSFSMSSSVEIIVHPGRKVTDELALALAISSDWLWDYYSAARGGG